MEIDGGNDVQILDPELLQLPGLSPVSLKENPHIAEELFSQWLSLPETGRLVKSLIDDTKSSTPVSVSKNCTSLNVACGSALPSVFLNSGTPPLSPRGSPGSPRFSRQKTSPSLQSPLKSVREPKRQLIPQFYFQHGRPPAKELREQCISMVDQFFSNYIDGLHMDEFKSITKEVCKLPSFLSSVLFRKIDTSGTGIVTR